MGSEATTKTATIRSWNGDMTLLTVDDLADFEASVRGKVIYPSDADYRKACQVWNVMIDRKPGLIVQCTGNADVVACVKFGKAKQLKICVRGGGHNIAGKSIKDDALMIDLSQWRNVFVDPIKQIVYVAPGSTLGDIDHETKEYGMVHAHGINSTTGIGKSKNVLEACQKHTRLLTGFPPLALIFDVLQPVSSWVAAWDGSVANTACPATI